jgi:eukaryotic-like serine/threonine-protein kinase
MVGTFQYMAPEQLEGKEPDARTDIFALGTVLYEMATGRRAFQGTSSASLIAAILRAQPAPIARDQPLAPPALDRVVATCLAKDPDDRWQNAHDLASELKWIAEGGSQAAAPTRVAGTRRERWAWTAAAAMAAVAVWALSITRWREAPPPAQSPVRLSIALPKEAPVAPAALSPLGVGRPTLAFSPDGRRIVYTAVEGSQTRFYARELDQTDARPIPGTEGGHSPFLSPDGQWIGFFAEGKLKKVPVSGGEPQVVAEASLPFGGSWAADDTIYFVPVDLGGIWQVPASGGEVKLVVPAQGRGRLSFHWPEWLPGSRGLVFSERGGGIEAYSFQTRQRKRLLDHGSFPRFVPPDQLLYAHEGRVMTVRFDPVALEISGRPRVVLEGVRTEMQGAGQFAASEAGSLVYAGGRDAARGSFVWVDRAGKLEPLNIPAGRFERFRISPDGESLALTIFEASKPDIWLYDFARATLTRFTSGGRSRSPMWSPDGQSIFFVRQFPDHPAIFSKPSFGSGPAVDVYPDGAIQSVFPDGRRMLLVRDDPATGSDLWVHSLDEPKAEPFARTAFMENLASVSPDGRWIAYTSDESGRWEVYVAPSGSRA